LFRCALIRAPEQNRSSAFVLGLGEQARQPDYEPLNSPLGKDEENRIKTFLFSMP
jgi:hypothetical protein